MLDASLGVQAVPVWHGQGAGASRTERLPALYPLVFEGTKKEAHPARFEATSLSRAGGALAVWDDRSPDERSDIRGAAARLIDHDPAYRYAHAGYVLRAV